MLFDTGASDVTISSVEANFMLKNRYLSDKDIKGKRYHQVATGELSAGTVITLREVMIRDVLLKNVEASVVGDQRAPLLFGQSAMERFGIITIDNEQNKLIIKCAVVDYLSGSILHPTGTDLRASRREECLVEC